MTRARQCPNCHRITSQTYCHLCSRHTTILPDIHLAQLHVDVTITLRLDHNDQPFLLIQKPSGQEEITLANHDLTARPA
jgi:recombinational DNA repair protein RecR